MIQNEAGPLAHQQPLTHRRLRGMDAHVKRRKALLHEARETPGSEVGERDVVPVREGKPKVVVLQPEAGARSRRISIDEAEHALVGTLADGIGRGNDAHRLSRVSLHLVNDRVAGLGEGPQLHRGLRQQEGQVDGVAHPLPVDADDAAADLERQLLGDASRLDGGDADHGTS